MSETATPEALASARVSLGVDLPAHWQLITDAAWEQPQLADSSGSSMISFMRSALSRVGRPDLLAAVFAPIAGPDDSITNIVMCSLTVECFLLDEMPDLAWPSDGEVESIEFSPGQSADMFRLTIAIRDDKLGVGAVSTFTTPNLTLVPMMIPGFRTVADSIKFLAADQPV